MKTGHSMEDIHISFGQIESPSSRQRDSPRHHWNNWAHSLEKLEAWIQQDQSGRHPATA